MKIVCIGNSIVNGFPLKRSQCFTGLLRSRYGYETINKGVNGDTTDGIYERFDSDVTAHRPDVCLLLTGTNDFIGGKSAEQAGKSGAACQHADDFNDSAAYISSYGGAHVDSGRLYGVK